MRETRPNRSAHEPAHDILAAEAFAVPAPDPRLRLGLVLPDDPVGIPEPHDILAAEEFAMPAPELGGPPWGARGPGVPSRSVRVSLAGVGLVALWLRRRRR